MELAAIPFEKLHANTFSLWDEQWFLLTAGDFEQQQFNCMTISWGSLGVIWGKPFVQVAVRPVRQTFSFINDYPDFTLCAFPEQHRKTLNTLGSKSGKQMDKMHASGLTPVKAELVAAPVYAEAELIFECRKMYWQDMDPGHFLSGKIDQCYPGKDYHRLFFGEVLAVKGIDRYQ